MCNNPRKPQRKPKPNATEDSGWKVSEASFNCNFSKDARKSSKSSLSIGYTPANTIGFTSSKPSIALSHGRAICVIVSPTFTSRDVFIPEIIYPTSPVPSSFRGDISNLSTPISSASYSLPVATNFTLSPVRITPFIILKYAMIPLNGLNTESNIRHCKGASGSPVGAGIRSIID